MRPPSTEPAHTITVRLKPPDRAKLERLAAAADRKPSSYLRWLLRQVQEESDQAVA
jgi:predicted transcriptional regulator